MTDKWQAGKTYVPGALVKPSSVQTLQTQATNGYFEEGDTGWDYTGGCAFSATGGYGSNNCCIVAGGAASGLALNQARFVMRPGWTIGATCMIQQGASDVDHTRGYVQIYFYDESDAQIGQPISGNIVNDGRHGAWLPSTITGAVAPAGTAYARAGIYLYQNSADAIWGDNLVVNYSYTVPPGLIFKATQAAPGKSGSSEPAWPTTTGVPVTDNEVTWEGVIATRLVWKAVPLLKSGATEPDWPEVAGAVVHDGTIDWVASTSQVTDANCPHSKVVAIMASKVFAADKDIVRFSATVNPLDWTSSQDAGYLPTGLQQANANDASVLAPYRSNLTVFNASSFQNWQVDPDPAAMAILDQMEGIGSNWQHAAQPVGDDLYYLSQLGVRSVSIAGGTDNLSAGDVGMPIDELVRAAVKLDSTTLGPRATYYPSAGQYWLAVTPAGGDPVVFVHTLNAGKGKWSRYLYPFSVDAFSQLGNDLYIRHGDEVSVVDETVATDDKDGVSIDFAGVVWWPWLNNGAPAQTKMLESIEYVGDGQAPSISIGYDQRDLNAFTAPYLIDADTLPGDPIPIPVAAPTMSVKLEFAGGEAWSVKQVSLNLSGMAGQP